MRGLPVIRTSSCGDQAGAAAERLAATHSSDVELLGILGKGRTGRHTCLWWPLLRGCRGK